MKSRRSRYAPVVLEGALKELQIVKRRQLAECLGCTPQRVDQLSAAGVILRTKLPGQSRAIGYRLSDVLELLNSRRGK